jgi:GNAT superfamily N-acetyltransferase
MNNNVDIRLANIDDLEIIFSLIKGLAEYEKLSSQVSGDIESLKEHLFGTQIYAEVILAFYQKKAVGYALFFPNYSTFLTKPGIYLEDLFVVSEYRRQGIGKSLLNYVIDLGESRNCGRVEWSVLDWNQTAIDFYEKIGADILPDWRICRILLD